MTLQARELGVADRRQDDAEERLADARHPAEEQVARVDLSLLVLVVRGRDLGKKDHVGERLFGFVADEGIAGLGDDGAVQVDGFLKLRMHAKQESYTKWI